MIRLAIGIGRSVVSIAAEEGFGLRHAHVTRAKNKEVVSDGHLDATTNPDMDFDNFIHSP
jgi:hypothetical protein